MPEENMYPVAMSRNYELPPRVVSALVNSTEFKNAVIALIADPVISPIISTSPVPPSGATEVAYTWTPGRTGTEPIIWSVSGGALPAGLNIDPDTGVVSGTPTTVETSEFTLQATNSAGTDAQNFTISVTLTPEDVFTVFGSTAPTEPASFSDADIGSWLSQMFYVPGTGASLSSAFIIGAKLYVPVGSSHIGRTWRAGLVRRTGPDVINDVSFGGQAQYTANGTEVEGSLLVAGWNEVDYAIEHPGVDNAEAFMIGIQIGDGTHYLHAGSGMSIDPIPAEGEANFVLAETTFRCWYRDTQSDAYWYGIDAKVRIPT